MTLCQPQSIIQIRPGVGRPEFRSGIAAGGQAAEQGVDVILSRGATFQHAGNFWITLRGRGMNGHEEYPSRRRRAKAPLRSLRPLTDVFRAIADFTWD